MEKWLVYPERLNEREQATLAEIDALLNFFELVCHVSGRDLYLHSSDREAAFQYWRGCVGVRFEQAVAPRGAARLLRLAQGLRAKAGRGANRPRSSQVGERAIDVRVLGRTAPAGYVRYRTETADYRA
jgi:hypothetical protein